MGRGIARKLNNQLAKAALAKQLEGERRVSTAGLEGGEPPTPSGGLRALEALSEIELQERLVELRVQQAEQKWALKSPEAGKKVVESLLKRKLNSATKKVRKQSARARTLHHLIAS